MNLKVLFLLHAIFGWFQLPGSNAQCNTIQRILDGYSTSIYSPGYPNFYHNPSGKKCRVTLISQSVEIDLICSINIPNGGPQCSNNNLTIWDNGHPHVYCGTGTNVEYTSSNTLTLELASSGRFFCSVQGSSIASDHKRQKNNNQDPKNMDITNLKIIGGRVFLEAYSVNKSQSPTAPEN
ncbi:venom serine protease 34-like [Drosophila elegans]|uniref:venom serine protease 34-like n=1 Tax=Drosophila elegans TaxID=30023 RepID=UPI001BC83332|nr:venom serine protease 34-like [Drosophila elegans]